MATIWKRATALGEINARLSRGVGGLLGIRVTAILPEALMGEMPVDDRHLQPFGLLHGGVSVVLSETLGSVATILASPEGTRAVGVEVNANHLAAVLPGQVVTAECRPFHTGRRTQVWGIEIRRADGKLACISRLTCAVLDMEG